MSWNTKDLTGAVFGLVTVVRREGSIGRNAAWLCECSCGQFIRVSSNRLRLGPTYIKSCAECAEKNKSTSMARVSHGHAKTKNAGPSAEYRTWTAMLYRCRTTTAGGYSNYGGRGIAVCERWQSFENFLADMGARPPGTTIDRINVDGGYEPGNCRWATSAQQQRNTRATKLNEVAVCLIRYMRRRKSTCADIGWAFDVTPQLVSKVASRKRWTLADPVAPNARKVQP